VVETRSSVRSSGRRFDRWLAVGITAICLFVFVVGPFAVRPWGDQAAVADDAGSFITGVALASDFLPFWTGAWMVRDGVGPGLYEMQAQWEFQISSRLERFGPDMTPLVQRLNPFHSPPPFALVFLPLTLLPIGWAFSLWSLVNVAFLIGAVAIHLRGAPWAQTTVALMLVSGFVGDMLFWGQVEGFFLLPLSLGLMALASGRPLLGGFLLGFLWLKPQYAVIFPLIFLLKGRWQELMGMLAAGGLVAAASVAMVGVDGILHYVETLRRIGGFYAPPESFVLPHIMVNWRAMLMNMWPLTTEEMGTTLVRALGVITVLVSLLVWRGRWEPASARFGWQMLVAMLAVVVATPHSHLHGVILLFAPLALVIGRTDRKRYPAMMGTLTALLLVGLVLSWGGWVQANARWVMAPLFLTSMALIMFHLLTGARESLQAQEAEMDDQELQPRDRAVTSHVERRRAA
jgi:hypothetical protein